jgi:hypothetical protein
MQIIRISIKTFLKKIKITYNKTAVMQQIKKCKLMFCTNQVEEKNNLLKKIFCKCPHDSNVYRIVGSNKTSNLELNKEN